MARFGWARYQVRRHTDATSSTAQAREEPARRELLCLCRPRQTARYQMRGCQGSNIGGIFRHVAFVDEMLLQRENA